MNGETHATIGVAAVTSLMAYGIVEPAIIPIAAATVGSLLPDIDHDKATINVRLGINKGAYIILAAALIYYMRSPMAYAIAAVLVAVGLSRHRALTHSLLAIAFMYLITIQLQPGIRIGLIIGYGVHLLSDYCTKRGIEVLYPYKKNYRAPITISTGKNVEWVVWAVATILVLINGVKLIWAKY